jgi:phage-related protein
MGWAVETLDETVDTEVEALPEASGWRVVIVRVFVKKTQKTPRSEIVLALSRAKSIR